MYRVLKNRMNNGTPFLKARAIERINGLANNLEITQEETEELMRIANQQGHDVLPDDAMGRLDKVEATTDDLTLMMADMMGGAF